MTNLCRRLIAMLAAATSLALTRPAAAAITADQLVLIVNRQQPAGRQLAEEYAKLRGVPDGRIVEVDVPDLDEIDRTFYDRSIALPVRRELASRGLNDKVRCAVLFYGMPLRIRERKSTPFDRAEVAQVLEPARKLLRHRIDQAATQLEAIARELTPTFAPAADADNAAAFQQRITMAERAIAAALPAVADASRREDVQARVKAAQSLITTLPPDLPGAPATAPTALPSQARVEELIAEPEDPAARRQLRALVLSSRNSFQAFALIDFQRTLLTETETEASVDSELSCVRLPNYPRGRWVPNPLFHVAQAASLRELMLRTCRIDGPTPEVARRIFNDSIVAEHRGLSGDVILDARGLSGTGGFGSYEYYDGTIRRAFDLFKGDAELPTMTDDEVTLIGDRVSQQAAIYCGWYQVRNFSPVASFVPGAIAIHVASYELINLRSPSERGWCRGLLLAGADATIGAVGEPYLLAFPPADDFLSLLLSGQPTLVEAYWATLPVTSWKMILIGDPLYRPFAARPALKVEQLSPSLRESLDVR